MPAGSGAHGLLGLDLFENTRLTIDLFYFEQCVLLAYIGVRHKSIMIKKLKKYFQRMAGKFQRNARFFQRMEFWVIFS